MLYNKKAKCDSALDRSPLIAAHFEHSFFINKNLIFLFLPWIFYFKLFTKATDGILLCHFHGIIQITKCMQLSPTPLIDHQLFNTSSTEGISVDKLHFRKKHTICPATHSGTTKHFFRKLFPVL